jgi:hypothetical protein
MPLFLSNSGPVGGASSAPPACGLPILWATTPAAFPQFFLFSNHQTGIFVTLVLNLQLQYRAIIGSNIGKILTSLLPFATSVFRSVVAFSSDL